MRIRISIRGLGAWDEPYDMSRVSAPTGILCLMQSPAAAPSCCEPRTSPEDTRTHLLFQKLLPNAPHLLQRTLRV